MSRKRLVLFGAMSVFCCVGAGPMPAATAADVNPNRDLEEVVVTATRRETNLQSTSAALSVFTGADLAKRGAVSITDIVNAATGVDLVVAQPGLSQIVLRGVATSNAVNSTAESLQNATTATYLDDFVIGNTFLKTPDIQLVDMARVEVLKGPQGTLYGQSAMGGVVRYITNKPDPSQVTANATVSGAYVEHGSGSYGANGYVNVPVMENVAVRVVGYYRHDGGFIDADVGNMQFFQDRFPPRGKNDSDDVETSGGRISASWIATESLTLDLGFLLNDIETGARQWVSSTFETTPSTVAPLGSPPAGLRPPNYDDPQVFTAMPTSVRNQAYNLRASYDLATVNVLLLAGRQTSNVEYWLDVSAGIDYFGYPTPEVNKSDADTDTVELRVVSNADDGARFDWIAGLWYEDTDGKASVFNRWEAPTTVVVFGLPLNPGDYPVDLRRFYRSNEVAAYGELTFNASEELAFTLGYRRSQVEVDTGFDRAQGKFDFYIGRSDLVGVPSKSEDDVNTYKAKVEYQFADDGPLLFALASSGYRAGGLNAGGLLVTPLPYESDTLWNYEIGAKTVWADGRVVANASVYYIDWKDIQLTTVLDPVTFTSGVANAGAATIQGFELETYFRPTDEVGLGANVGYTNAELAEDYDPEGQGDPVAEAGDPLPGSAEWRYALFADWSRTLGSGLEIGARAFFQSVGERRSVIGSSTVLPSYTRTDLRFFVNLDEGLSLTAFVDNVTDEIGRTATIDNGSYVDNVYVTRPRTIGLTVSKDFR